MNYERRITALEDNIEILRQAIEGQTSISEQFLGGIVNIVANVEVLGNETKLLVAAMNEVYETLKAQIRVNENLFELAKVLEDRIGTLESNSSTCKHTSELGGF